MIDLYKNIKQRRIELCLTQSELAEKLGYADKSMIAKIEAGKVDLPQSKIVSFAKALETTPKSLMGWEDHPQLPPFPNIHPIAKRKFPLFDGIAAGKPRIIPDGIECYVDATVEIEADYVLKVHGDSMTGARIHDGDLVFIRQQPMVENGQIAAVRIGDEATLKRVYYYQAQQMLVLRAENPAYKDMEFYGQELEDVQILGKAIAFQSNVK